MIIIAELCQNHSGDFDLLKEMVYSAKESGADYAKIQTIFADMLSFRNRFETGIEEDGVTSSVKRPYKSEYERLKGLELSYKKQLAFIEICEDIGIKALTTAFNIDSIRKIKEIGFKDIKIASYDCASLPLLKEVKDSFDTIFLSTGATYDEEITNAAELLKGSNFALLHCVTMYPTPLDEYNLSRMKFLRRFTDRVGWSDHSLVDRDGIKGTIAAIYYGADVIERHFRIRASDESKDGPVSIDPSQLKELTFASKLSQSELETYLAQIYPEFATTFGKPRRELSDMELLNRDYFRGRFCNRLKAGEFYYNWEVRD